MRFDQLAEMRFQPRENSYKIREVIGIGLLHEMVNGLHCCDGQRFIVLIAGTQEFDQSSDLSFYGFDGPFQIRAAQVYPRQPQMCFVGEQSRIDRAVGNTAYELIIR